MTFKRDVREFFRWLRNPRRYAPPPVEHNYDPTRGFPGPHEWLGFSDCPWGWKSPAYGFVTCRREAGHSGVHFWRVGSWSSWARPDYAGLRHKEMSS